MPEAALDAHTARSSDFPTDPDQMLPTRAVARRFGISVRTLDRWLSNHIAFPKPDMLTHDVKGRVANRFWRLRTLTAWESHGVDCHGQKIA
jgi:predicted DNA-binding transcriptional regulator AlpA